MLEAISVRNLTLLVRELLEGSALLKNFWVTGEVSNFKAHSSGHCYFTLKDDHSSVRCVMWRSRTPSLRFRPTDGMKVLARGSIAVYERDGTYQFYADQVEPDGLGSLYAAYEQLKARLEAEGLFSQSRKRKLPRFPRVVALVTSPTGAAVRDMIKIMARRWPLADVLVVPAIVQGAEAAPSIVSALDSLSAYPAVDVAIVGRGGGSIEDLWAFNDEAVARSIARCACPVVSAVGHETDFTIADFVADQRGETPSGAAMLVVPDRDDLARQIEAQAGRLSRGMERQRAQLRQQIDVLSSRLEHASPRQRLKDYRTRQAELKRRITQSLVFLLSKERNRLATESARLQALSPLRVLARGYSLTRDAQGRVIRDQADISIGDQLETTILYGKIVSVVTGRGE